MENYLRDLLAALVRATGTHFEELVKYRNNFVNDEFMHGVFDDLVNEDYFIDTYIDAPEILSDAERSEAIAMAAMLNDRLAK